MAEKQKSVICKVLRPFKYQGKILKVGTTQELPEVFANAMKIANKVEYSGGSAAAEKSEAVDPMSAAHKSGKK